MNSERFVNIVRMIVQYNSIIDNVLPDNLRCSECRSVLRDACQGPCGCRLCRACINDAVAGGAECCPGPLEECSGSPLLEFVTDFIANNSISKLIIQCPQDGCTHECQLTSMDDHMRVCLKRAEQCPFRELGCTLDQLCEENIGCHLEQENRRHSELLVDMIAKMNREMERNTREIELLKQSRDDKNREIEVLKENDDSNKREIEVLRQKEEDRTREIETLKSELVLKYEEVSTIMEQMIHVTNENKSVKDEIKSIKDERDSLVERVRNLTEKIEKEINERLESDEIGSGIMLECVNREISSITATVRSNREELIALMRPVTDEFKSIKEAVKSECSIMQSRMQPIEALARLGPIDATCEWVIDGDVARRGWSTAAKASKFFSVRSHSSRYSMASTNDVGSTADGRIVIELRIHRGMGDADFDWPFIGTVVITVGDKTRRESCKTIALTCRIWRPTNTEWNGSSEKFIFPHSELIGAGVDLSGGLRVSCVIVRGVGP